MSPFSQWWLDDMEISRNYKPSYLYHYIFNDSSRGNNTAISSSENVNGSRIAKTTWDLKSLNPAGDQAWTWVFAFNWDFLFIFLFVRDCVNRQHFPLKIPAFGLTLPLTRPLGAGTFVRCSSESPLSLADGVWNILKEVSQGATKIPSRTRVVLLRKRNGKSIFDWGWLQLSLFESSLQLCGNEPTVPGSTHIWSRCCLEFVSQPPAPKSNPLSPDPRCHRVRPAVIRFPSTCAMLPWRTSYGQGTATMLAGV
ncbi:hypothetical protein PIB30_032418 [Stylosanthes scabra]|uniref:Uncharacterized protein n=1 Tax=Stylosanthes scabra TaxID=79078 RepID=A0ABU6Y9I9_9FABA|nr:hypothetical protein [Stylosanthes scabra]